MGPIGEDTETLKFNNRLGRSIYNQDGTFKVQWETSNYNWTTLTEYGPDEETIDETKENLDQKKEEMPKEKPDRGV